MVVGGNGRIVDAVNLGKSITTWNKWNWDCLINNTTSGSPNGRQQT
jgi:hypothetical protein